jgi:hypothetical protein
VPHVQAGEDVLGQSAALVERVVADGESVQALAVGDVECALVGGEGDRARGVEGGGQASKNPSVVIFVENQNRLQVALRVDERAGGAQGALRVAEPDAAAGVEGEAGREVVQAPVDERREERGGAVGVEANDAARELLAAVERAVGAESDAARAVGERAKDARFAEPRVESENAAFAGARAAREDAEEHAGAVPREAGRGSFEGARYALEAPRHRYPTSTPGTPTRRR